MSAPKAAAGPRTQLVRQFIQCMAMVATLATPVAAQVPQMTTAHIVEFDLPAPADASPGAMIVDSQGRDKNRLWFVTRLGNQRVVRLDAARSLMKGQAQWKSWELADDSVTTGGLKRIRASNDRRFVFVRTASSIQRIDTQNCDSTTCERTEWLDQVGSLNVSDLAVDDYNNIFTASAEDPTTATMTSYIQKLTPGPSPANGTSSTATVTRWTVGGGAGFCAELPGRTSTSFPCLSGIAVDEYDANLIYYAEPEGTPGSNGNIGELNIYTGNVRRFPMSALGADVQQPRQLIIDRWDIVWVNTGSGHLVSLDPRKNVMRKHAIPLNALSDPFGIAPDDDVVGYTDAAQNKVGMLFPKGPTVPVSPTTTPATKTTVTKMVLGERATFASGAVPPHGKVVDATIFTKGDGVFVEAQLDSRGNDSMSPLGITPNKGKGQGNFFYAVSANATANPDPTSMFPTADRVGFVRLPKPQKVRHPRDDDDAEDGWDHNSHPPGWHTSAANDDDDDGLENAFDLPTAREDVQVVDNAPAIAGGQSADFPVTTSPTSVALIATATADDLLAQIGVEIYDGLGMLVAASAPALGVAVATVPLPAAGTYKVRVRNYNLTPMTHTPQLIVREPWLP